MDVSSLVSNVAVGNYGAAAVDLAGLAADAAATVIPGVPGGAGYAIKAGRAGAKLADNAKDAKKVTKIVKEGSEKVKRNIDQTALNRGRKNEQKVISKEGLTKNNKTHTVVDPKTKKSVNTKPDAEDARQVSEIKDTKTLSNTKQIRAQREYAKQQGKDYKIYTGKNTKVSKNIPEKEIVRKNYLGPQKKN